MYLRVWPSRALLSYIGSVVNLVCFGRITTLLPGPFVCIPEHFFSFGLQSSKKFKYALASNRRCCAKRQETSMKRRKKLTPATREANKNNSKKSTGPKSSPGKDRASKNAISHAFFAQELVLNEKERRQLETLRRSLHPQLAPITVMQNLKFAEIVVWIGRGKLGLRADMRHIGRLLGQDTAQQAQSSQPEAAGADWYLSGREGLRYGKRLLKDVKQEFLNLGRIDEKWHAVLDKAFGPQLRQLMTGWTASDETVVMLARQITMHSETYNLPLSPALDPKTSAEDGGNKVKIILDPEQNKQLIVKLLEFQESVLSDLSRTAEERASSAVREQNGASDPPRHFSVACRELDRAIDQLMYLKKNKI